MSAKQIQLGKGVGQLPRKNGAFLTVDGFTGADDDEKACFQVGTAGVVRRTQDALSAVALYGAADLLGDRQTQTVDGSFLGMRVAQLTRRQIPQDVDGAVFPHEALAASIRLIVQMIFFDGNIFHRSPAYGMPYIKNPDARKTEAAFGDIGSFYVQHTDGINRSVFFCP